MEIAESLNLGQRENIEAILEATEDWNTNDEEIKVHCSNVCSVS